ncbi:MULTISPECIES: GNAT family N-acetyltransferase [unclassified Pseudomonas]|uniref:GNAT family N-acetyltransferase n=1 Tax=unclassified Pseudomonas TaxID=196821 RepID=UPI0008383DED|nr:MULTISPECIES: GNAT family N-acetyltransferase [unclassified Pseudomonas]QIH10646.1 GNAT family N-acetyltransferase [Pseudomonas sp. BIOMIG1BAC]
MEERYCLLMRRDLTGPQLAPQWPAGVSLQSYSLELAPQVHHLMQLGYLDGGGRVPDLDTWRKAFETDAEYDPDLCLVLLEAGHVIGVAQCWTSAYLKDLVVHADARGRGLGRALLQQVFVMFAERREERLDLKVLEDNLRARRLYDSAGMQVVRRERVP